MGARWMSRCCGFVVKSKLWSLGYSFVDYSLIWLPFYDNISATVAELWRRRQDFSLEGVARRRGGEAPKAPRGSRMRFPGKFLMIQSCNGTFWCISQLFWRTYFKFCCPHWERCIYVEGAPSIKFLIITGTNKLIMTTWKNRSNFSSIFTRFRDIIAAFALPPATFSNPTSSLHKMSPCSPGVGGWPLGRHVGWNFQVWKFHKFHEFF